MHEFALAENIITTVCEKITGDLTNVSEINIEVGVFAGVVTESLEFGLKLILNEKNVPDITININEVPAEIKCECGKKYKITDMFEGCPDCASFNRSISSGTDVLINSVELKDG